MNLRHIQTHSSVYARINNLPEHTRNMIGEYVVRYFDIANIYKAVELLVSLSHPFEYLV